MSSEQAAPGTEHTDAAPHIAEPAAASCSDSAPVTVRVTAKDVTLHAKDGRGLLTREQKEWGILKFVDDWSRSDVAGKAMLLIHTATCWPTLLLRGMQRIRAKQVSTLRRRRADLRRAAAPADALVRQRERMALLRKKRRDAKKMLKDPPTAACAPAAAPSTSSSSAAACTSAAATSITCSSTAAASSTSSCTSAAAAEPAFTAPTLSDSEMDDDLTSLVELELRAHLGDLYDGDSSMGEGDSDEDTDIPDIPGHEPETFRRG